MQKIPIKDWFPVFIRRFRKYFLLLLLTAVITVPLISVSSHLARQRILDSSQHRLASGLQAMDSQVRRSMDLMQTLLKDEHFVSLLLLKGEGEAKHYMDASNVQKQLRSYVGSQEMLSMAYLIFQKNQVFITDQMSFDQAQRAYPSFFSYPGLTLEDCRQLMFSGPFELRFLCDQQYTVGENLPQDAFIYLLNTTYYTSLDNSCVMGSIIDRQSLVQEMLIEDVQQTGLLVLTSQATGELLLTHNSEGLEQDGKPVPATRERLTLITEENDLLGIKAVAGIPESILQRDFDQMVKIAIVLFAAGFFAIFTCTVLFSLREAQNLRRLIDVTAQSTGMGWQSRDEYAFLQESIQQMDSENKKRLLRMQQLSQQVASRMLNTLLLEGIYTPNEEETLLQYFGGRFTLYQVIKLRLEGEAAPAIYELESLLQQTLPMGFESLLLPPGEILVLLFYSEMPPEGELISCLTSFLDVLEQRNLPVSMGLSDVCSGLREVHTAYLRAQFALQFSDITIGQGSIGIYKPEAQLNDQTMLDTALPNRLYGFILAGSKKDVETVFTHIRSQFFAGKTGRTDQMQAYYSLRQAVYNAGLEILPPPRGGDGAVLQMLEPDAHPDAQPEKQIDLLNRAALTLCDLVNNKKKSGNAQLREGILAYIHEHYPDADLNAAKIAEEFGITEKYVFLFIKEQTGQPLGNLIESIRLDEVERLLAETNDSNKSIAEKTGFGSENTFYRAFARRHGVSPAVWRKNRAAE